MSKRTLTFKQCDIERAMRAAKAVGQSIVEIAKDGTIRIIPPEQYDARHRQPAREKKSRLF